MCAALYYTVVLDFFRGHIPMRWFILIAMEYDLHKVVDTYTTHFRVNGKRASKSVAYEIYHTQLQLFSDFFSLHNRQQTVLSTTPLARVP